eukprot:3295428-Karenia_brevis.AAC.1
MAASQSSHQHFVLGLQDPVALRPPATGPSSSRPQRISKAEKRSEEFKNLLQRPLAGAAKGGLASTLENIAKARSQEGRVVPEVEKEERCQALVGSGGMLSQCKNAYHGANRLCAQHTKSLPLGRVNFQKCMART